MPSEWRGAAVDPGDGKPTPEEWRAVEVPGRPAAFAGADGVAYRTVFDDPREPSDAMAMLELRGLYAGGTVWLNDERVAETDAVFDPVRVPFEPEAENELVVECRAPTDRFGGIHDTERVPAAASVPGIWWGVDVTTHPASFVTNVDVSPRVTDDGGAIDAAVEVYAGEALDDRVTLMTKPAGERRGRGMMDRARVTAAAGERVVAEHTIELRDPSLWWPRGLGQQHRYEVRAKLDGAVATATTGLATVDQTDDGTVQVNGEAVPIRGIGLHDAVVADVDRAIDVNANLVRAHAHVFPREVYRACDEAGLLVWQDLPLTGPGSFDVDRGRDLVGRLARTYSNNPSLVAMGIHDDPTAAFADRVGSGLLDRLRFRWRVWRSGYDRGPADEVAEAVPDGLVVYPVVGEPWADPDAAALYPGWDYGSVDDLDWVRDRYDVDGAVGEFGAGSLADTPDGESEDSLAGLNQEKHDAVVGGDDPELSQAYQAEIVRGVAERLRTDGVRVVVADALRDVGDAGMGVYARDGEPKAAVESLAAAFEPVQAFLVGADPGECEAVVVNNTPDPVSATLTWEAADQRGQADLTVDATGQTVVETVSVPKSANSVELTLRSGDQDVTNTSRL